MTSNNGHIRVLQSRAHLVRRYAVVAKLKLEKVLHVLLDRQRDVARQEVPPDASIIPHEAGPRFQVGFAGSEAVFDAP